MKINFVMHIIDPFGGVRAFFEIMNRLSDRGHDVTLTTPHKSLTFPLKAKCVCAETKLEKLMRRGIAGVLKFYQKIGLASYSLHHEIVILNDVKHMPECDINVGHNDTAARAIFRSKKGIPCHYMQHFEEIFFEDDFYRKSVAEECMYLPINRIVNSTWLKNKMKEKYDYDLPVINPAIDHDVFYPRDVKKNNDKFRVLCFGKQTRWKGFPEAIEAMKIVMEKRNNIEFIVFGTSQPFYNSDVSYKFVKFPTDDELAKLYSSVDVIICPSWYESFPLPPIEAMACGGPVVTTQYGTEDYAFHEKNCLVVPPKNPKALACAILRLLEDKNLRENFKKEGPKTARQFTWDKTVDKVENYFLDLMEKNK